jgi:hypothetical protein
MWVLHHIGWSLAILSTAAIAWWLTPTRWRPLGRYVRWTAQLFCACALAWLAVQTVQAMWDVTNRDRNDPACVEVGEFARAQLPDHAVLFCDEPKQYEHLMIMFYADRTCYPLRGQVPNELAAQVETAGGESYLVTRRRLPLPIAYACSNRGPIIYRWQPPVLLESLKHRR